MAQPSFEKKQGGHRSILRIRHILGLLLLSVFCHIYPQEQTLFDQVRDKELRPSDYALPANSLELALVDVFPDDSDADEGVYLQTPVALKGSSNGLLYIPDQRTSEIYCFDLAGRLKGTYGGFGQGPGEFQTPFAMDVFRNKLFVRDINNARLQILNDKGEYQSSFKTFDAHWSIAAAEDVIYAVRTHYQAPSDPKSSLIDVLDFKGEVLSSFGEVMEANPYDHWLLLRAEICLDPAGEVWIAFCFRPIVRRYSAKGDLLEEFRLSYAMTDRKEALNRKKDRERTKFIQATYYRIITAIFVSGRGLYLAVDSHQRLDIVLMKQGRISEFYWHPLDRKHVCAGLFVLEERTGPRFFVLDQLSDRVEVYAKKAGQ